MTYDLVDASRLTQNPRHRFSSAVAAQTRLINSREPSGPRRWRRFANPYPKRQAAGAAAGELEISGVIGRESKALGEAHRRGPRLICRFIIEADRQSPQKTGQTMSPGGIEASAPFGDQCFERPEPGRRGARFQQGCRRRRPLVFKAQRQRPGVIQDKTHDRPSLIRSLILRPPRVTPRLASSRPWTARRAFARSKPRPAGISFATI